MTLSEKRQPVEAKKSRGRLRKRKGERKFNALAKNGVWQKSPGDRAGGEERRGARKNYENKKEGMEGLDLQTTTPRENTEQSVESGSWQTSR